MSTLLRRSGRRYLRRHPWLLALSLLGVTLGVAVVTAIDLASESARRAFTLGAETLSGRASHHIVAGPAGIDERLYAGLRLAGHRGLVPVVEGYLQLPGRTLQLLGVDPLVEAPAGRPGSRGANLTALLTEPGALLLSRATGAALGLEPGAGFTASAGGRQRALHLAGWLEAADPVQARALDGLAVADIATAQELLGRQGRLSRIDVVLPAAARAAGLARLATALPPGVRLEPAGRDAVFMHEVTAAFTLNLTALSLLALLVGAFLVYNTMTFAVLQRLPQLAILRALGVTRGELFRLVSVEALLLGAVGTAAGLLLGLLLGNGLVGLVARTFDDLYFTLTVSGLFLAPWSLAKGVLLGLGATWLAALAPALAAARVTAGTLQRRSALEGAARRLTRLAALAGGALLLVAVALPLASDALLAGFAALFALLLGAALLAPFAVRGLAWLLQRLPLARAGPVPKLALRGLVATLSRTGVATAALAVAVAAAVGLGLMIDSFRLTVERWLDQRLQADVYVSAPGALDGTLSNPLPAVLPARLAALDGVRATSSYRGATVASPVGPVNLAVVDIARAGRAGHVLLAGDPATAWAAFAAGAVLLSEPFAHRRQLALGDTLRLQTPAGMQAFPVAGIYTDFVSGSGRVLMARSTWLRHWRDPAISSVGLYAEPGVDVEALVAAARAAADPATPLTVRSNRALREASLQVFDRTFRITGVLRLLALGVACVGIFGACLMLQEERAREFAMLRALGLLPGQLRGLVVVQTLLLGAAAGLLALPLGVALAELLTTVINRRAFGWSLALEVTPGPLIGGLLLALGAALVAGLLAGRGAGLAPAAALRGD
jgi:putative ABC transport system permease protein